MLNQSAQQYIKAQAEFYHSQGCINQKYEVVASPSYMSIYKNKTEEQILYEFLREKRGPSKKHADVVMTPSSNLERERTELINKRQSDHSFSNMDEPSEYLREQKISQSRDMRPSVVNLEKSQSGSFSNRDKEGQANRDNFINSGVSPIEKNIEVEDNKPKKGLSLKDKLLQKKKEMETSKAEKLNLEPSSISKNSPSLSGNKESRKEEVNEESAEIPLRKKELINTNNREDELGERLHIKKEEEVPNKMDLSTLTLNSDVGDLASGEYARRGYMEESNSLMNKVSDVPKQSAYEKKLPKDKEQQEQQQQEGKLKRIFEPEQQQTQGYAPQKNVDYETRSGNQKEDMYNKSKQAGLHGISSIEDDEEREPLQKKKEPSVVERDSEQDNGRRNMRQSQASNSSRQRGQRDMEEQDFDDAEREPLSAYYKEQMQKSKGYMGTSPSLSQKEAQGYEYRGLGESGYRVRQQDSMPPKSETSIVESNEKKIERSEKAGARPVVSYLKSIEEMLFKIMAKQDALEENQRKMMQMMNRQQEEIETIRLQMTGEEE